MTELLAWAVGAFLVGYWRGYARGYKVGFEQFLGKALGGRRR